jgi:hypothetical protein
MFDVLVNDSCINILALFLFKFKLKPTQDPLKWDKRILITLFLSIEEVIGNNYTMERATMNFMGSSPAINFEIVRSL